MQIKPDSVGPGERMSALSSIHPAPKLRSASQGPLKLVGLFLTDPLGPIPDLSSESRWPVIVAHKFESPSHARGNLPAVLQSGVLIQNRAPLLCDPLSPCLRR